jgi:hypothetical protein
MHGTYEQNKASILRWRAKNKESHSEMHRRHSLKSYRWKKIRFEFLAILL